MAAGRTAPVDRLPVYPVPVSRVDYPPHATTRLPTSRTLRFRSSPDRHEAFALGNSQRKPCRHREGDVRARAAAESRAADAGVERRIMKRAAGLILNGLIVTLAIAGCGGQKNPLLLPNQPPEVELFARRLDHSGTGPHAYRLQWVGRDPDGRIDHYLYALGSPGENPRTAPWTATSEHEHPVSFPARAAAPARASIAAIEPSIFSVQAVDGLGARS